MTSQLMKQFVQVSLGGRFAAPTSAVSVLLMVIAAGFMRLRRGGFPTGFCAPISSEGAVTMGLNANTAMGAFKACVALQRSGLPGLKIGGRLVLNLHKPFLVEMMLSLRPTGQASGSFGSVQTGAGGL